MSLIKKPPGLVVAYMQARLPAKRAKTYIDKQRKVITRFVLEYGIRVDLWYFRAKGISPVPTIEELICSGKVYCLIAQRWDNTQECKGYWPPIWQLLGDYKVRHIYIKERMDFRYHNEPNVFEYGWYV